MILIISIELRKKQAHKQIDDTLESCNMHMYGQKFFNTMEHFLGMQKQILDWEQEMIYNKLPQFPIYFGIKRPFH